LGIKNAVIFGVAGLIIGFILVSYIMSQIAIAQTPETSAIWELGVPLLFSLAGALAGYAYNEDIL